MSAQEVLSPSLQPPHGLCPPGVIWGMDPSTVRLSVCAVGPIGAAGGPNVSHPFAWYTSSYSTAGGMDRRLAAALRTLLQDLTDVRNRHGIPCAIYLEQPFAGSDKPNPKTGKVLRPHPHSYYFVAVVLCALGHLFSDVPVEMIDPNTWKAKAMGQGRGHADKEAIMRWAQSVGYTGQLQDEADAIGIATAGAVILSA